MLQEMSRPVRLISLEPRAGVNPNSNCGRLRGEVRLGGDAESVRQSRDFGLRRGEDVRVGSKGRVRGSVLQELRVGVF